MNIFDIRFAYFCTGLIMASISNVAIIYMQVRPPDYLIRILTKYSTQFRPVVWNIIS